MGMDQAQQNSDSTARPDPGRLATNALQAEANLLRGQPDMGSGEVILIKVQPKDTILSIGRFLYQSRLERAPTDLELKDFVTDTVSRNSLSKRGEVLAPKQVLFVRTPAVSPGNGVEFAHSMQKSVKGDTPKANVSRVADPCFGFTQKIGELLIHNEAQKNSFTAYRKDDRGMGVSIGQLQWNQKGGKLPELLESWHDKNPRKFNWMFDGYADRMLDESWVRNTNFNNYFRVRVGIRLALADREFQQVQVALRNEQVRNSCQLARSHGFTSLRGMALVADLVNQIGYGGTHRNLSRISAMPNESTRIEMLKKQTDWRAESSERLKALENHVEKTLKSRTRQKGNGK